MALGKGTLSDSTAVTSKGSREVSELFSFTRAGPCSRTFFEQLSTWLVSPEETELLHPEET